KPLDIVHVLPSPIAVYTCDAPAEKAFDALRIFMPTVVFVKAASRCAAQIILECRPSVSSSDEYYSIDASSLPVMVRFRAFIGGRNAAVTLAQLINKADDGYSIGGTVIEDEPDEKLRTILLDPARTLIPINELKDTMIRLAMAKYNLIHFHLSDSQGLAYKSDKYPQVDGPHGKQYTKAELRDIVAFADSIGLEMMPEVEFPGHGTQILKDIPELACRTINGDPSPWAMCAGNEYTYKVLEDLYTEIAEIFPGRFIHVGTDEIGMYDLKERRVWPTWDDCAVCKAMCAREGIDNNNVVEIFYYMLRRVYGIISKLGKRMVMWNDYIDISKSPELPRDILILFWRVAGENRGPREGCSMQRFLEEGFECLNSYYPETYIERDFYRNKDETILVWDPHKIPETDPALADQILGGGPCAWGERDGLGHFKWTLASSIFMFGDRLWNNSVCNDLDSFGVAASRWALGIDTPKDFNVYKEFGGFMQPRSINGVRMWVDKAAADLSGTYEVLKSIQKPHTYTGRLAGEYVLSVEWLNEKRKENN
nr:family 20 glycosylhydrolase [Clostridia bacterium]